MGGETMIWKVGQRVKLVKRKTKEDKVNLRCNAGTIPLGTEGFIVKIPTQFSDCLVVFDCSNVPRNIKFYQLEPVHPERNKIVAWDDCLWQPNKEGVEA